MSALVGDCRPSVVYRPTISIDGDKWCALYGANLQDGVSGFGDSPAEAMAAFDLAWHSSLPRAGLSRPTAEPTAVQLEDGALALTQCGVVMPRDGLLATADSVFRAMQEAS